MWAFPSDMGGNDQPRVIIRRLTVEQTHQLRDMCHRNGFTVNDALMAAYIRAFDHQAVFPESTLNEADKHAAPQPARMIGITIDLWRYLKERPV